MKTAKKDIIIRALTFARSHLSDKPKPISENQLRKHLGQSEFPLGQLLRSKLLICESDYYSAAKQLCKLYSLNKQGYDELMTEYGLEEPNLIEQTRAIYKDQLQTGLFHYKEQTNRLWNPLQNLRSDYRDELFKQEGYAYSYDIQSCAPTLLIQLAQRINNSIKTPHLTVYINNPKECRQEVARCIGVSEEEAKTLLTSLFNGAKLSHTVWSSNHTILKTKEQAKYLRDHPFIKGMQSEIKAIHKLLSYGGEIQSIWDIFFAAERVVVDSALSFISGRVFRIHDGWYSDQEVDVTRLEKHIHTITGFTVSVNLTYL
jgi:hypothetical protein